MSTRRHFRQPESTTDRPTPSPAATPPSDPNTSATDRAPATFSRGNRERLENLIDEWNAGFAASTE
ncbi:hypothetical protein [Natronococcus wangiae]|uniref:hypothetical protein n=1 Tax=Natronococcus wangiae TaxID=3068275 RepID=UPI00273F9C8D|nr:hypothetical protein [Natronococcus sp. AD5]